MGLDLDFYEYMQANKITASYYEQPANQLDQITANTEVSPNLQSLLRILDLLRRAMPGGNHQPMMVTLIMGLNQQLIISVQLPIRPNNQPNQNQNNANQNQNNANQNQNNANQHQDHVLPNENPFVSSPRNRLLMEQPRNLSRSQPLENPESLPIDRLPIHQNSLMRRNNHNQEERSLSIIQQMEEQQMQQAENIRGARRNRRGQEIEQNSNNINQLKNQDINFTMQRQNQNSPQQDIKQKKTIKSNAPQEMIKRNHKRSRILEEREIDTTLTHLNNEVENKKIKKIMQQDITCWESFKIGIRNIIRRLF